MHTECLTDSKRCAGLRESNTERGLTVKIVPLSDKDDMEAIGYIAKGIFDDKVFIEAIEAEWEPDGVDVERVRVGWCRWKRNEQDPERPLLDMRASPDDPGAFEATILEL